jgi:hypothetical protein
MSEALTLLNSCSNLATGVPVLACFSQSTHYIPGYLILIIFGLVVYFNQSEESVKIKGATTTFAMTLIGTFLAAGNIIQDAAWGILVVLTISAAANLMMEKS